MASIHRDTWIHVRPETAWSALRDVGALHRRLAKGFVTDVALEDGVRRVTFANGAVAQERIIAIDENRRRVVWSVVGGAMSHHNASAQVLPESGGTRFVWIADLLPDELAPRIEAMIEAGLVAIRQTLESDPDGAEHGHPDPGPA